MNLVINAISAKRGGAATYLNNVLSELRTQLEPKGQPRIVVWRGAASTAGDPWPDGFEYRQDRLASGGDGAAGGSLRRLWFDQVELPRQLRAEGVDVLYSSANYGPLRPPCRQVLLVRNPIYFDPTFMSRMRTRKVRAYHLLQRWLTQRCMSASDVVLFPTQAMLDLVASHTQRPHANWRVAHYGTRHDLFHPAAGMQSADTGAVRLLHVSLYSDQKNLGVLLSALQSLSRAQPERYHLRLTAGFDQDWLGGSAFFPNFRREQALYAELHSSGVADDVNWKQYGSLPDLYRSADIFVFPSYTESFGHPLVEAMASGLPIVAADAPSNRELCADAAVYFPAFDVEKCAMAIQTVSDDAVLRDRLSSAALRRAASFTWERHVSALVEALRGESS